MRQPAQIDAFLTAHAHRMDGPTQFLGDEPNAVRKPWDAATVRWLLMASWPYEHAAGNGSIPTVYKAINAGTDYLADRYYLPATARDLRLLDRGRIPPFGIETKRVAAAFDIVATSIAYPLLSMSYAKLLHSAGIPLRWRDRAANPADHPMLIVGGLGYGAPEMLSPIVDAWWCGEVEDEPGNPGIRAVCAAIADLKADGAWDTDRESCYRSLAREYNFLYFPRFVDVHYAYEDRRHVGLTEPSKQVVGYTSNLEGMRLPFTRRIVKDLDGIEPLHDAPLLYVDPTMAAGDLEVARGCPAWCSFCALTYRQKPFRQRSVESSVSFAKQLATNMGSLRIAPFAPDFPMHTQRKELVARLLTEVSDEVDAPAMRVDDFNADNQFILLQVNGGMDAVTLGVEGNSQRMRDLIGKGTSDADIREAVTRGIRAGIRKFKLFMISNLPGEDEGDLFRILKLGKDLADIRDQMNQPNVRIQLSWTPLMIEGNTPMQWFAPTVPTRLLGDVWEELRDIQIDYKLGSKGEPNKIAFFQLCQRASRDIGEAIVDTLAELDQATWGGVPRHVKDLLESHLHRRGFANGYGDCFDERFKGDLFGWEFIDQGINIQLLWETYLQMREFAENTDSHSYDLNFADGYGGQEWLARCDVKCHGKACGACDHTDLRIRTGYIRAGQNQPLLDIATVKPVDQRSQALRIRARLHKNPAYRFVSNGHWRHSLRRAAFRAEQTLNCPFRLAKRSIRFASDDLKGHDHATGVDYLEFSLTRAATAEQVDEFLVAMNRQLDPWLRIGDHITQQPGATTMRADFHTALYDVDCDTTLGEAWQRLGRWHAADTVVVKVRAAGGYFAPTTQDIDVKTLVDDLWLIRDGAQLRLRMLLRGNADPHDIFFAFSGHRAGALVPCRRDGFISLDRGQQDFLRPNCARCGLVIPVNLLDQPYHVQYCPHCLDVVQQHAITDKDLT